MYTHMMRPEELGGVLEVFKDLSVSTNVIFGYEFLLCFSFENMP